MRHTFLSSPPKPHRSPPPSTGHLHPTTKRSLYALVFLLLAGAAIAEGVWTVREVPYALTGILVGWLLERLGTWRTHDCEVCLRPFALWSTRRFRLTSPKGHQREYANRLCWQHRKVGV